jgi:hypothetical protein
MKGNKYSLRWCKFTEGVQKFTEREQIFTYVEFDEREQIFTEIEQSDMEKLLR